MKMLARVAALVGVAALLPACGGFQGFFVPFPNTVANGILRSSQVVPANLSAATGTATVTVDGLRKFVDYMVDVTGLTGAATAIEIHLGGPGTNGPALFTIPLGAFPLAGRLTAANLTPAGGVTTFSQAGDVIAAGGAYLLIRSSGAPDGEVRAHLGKAHLASAALTGGQVPIGGVGTGTFTVDLDDSQAKLQCTLSVAGLTSATTLAELFDAPPGSPGTTALFTVATGAFTSPIGILLTSTNFTGSAGAPTFPDAVNLLLSGGLYIQVSTTTNLAGELRGQIGPTQMKASLTGGAVVNPTASLATGTATLAFNADQTGFFVTLTHNVAAADRVGLNAESTLTNGPKIFDLDAVAGAAISPLNATIAPIHLIPNAPQNIDTFPEAVDAILVGRTYLEVGNVSFPGGEIRGQILP